MFQSFHVKWFLVLTGVLTVTTLLMKIGEPQGITITQSLGHIAVMIVNMSGAWFIHAYFKQTQNFNASNGTRVTVSTLLGTLFLLSTNYVYALYVPQSIIVPEAWGRNYSTDFIRRLTEALLLCLVAIVVYNNVDAESKLQKSKLENEQLKQADLRAHLISLQQQISPHFLFNSLSALKTIATDRDTKDFIIQLSKVYRYVLNFNEHHIAKLSEELTFIESYIYIMHKRLGKALKVSIDIPQQYLGYLIPPLSLQLLIENAIKHNALSPENPLHIQIFFNEHDELVVSNSNHPKRLPEESTKLGLKNIGDRFELLFDKKIKVCHTAEDFIVTLPLISYERYHH